MSLRETAFKAASELELFILQEPDRAVAAISYAEAAPQAVFALYDPRTEWFARAYIPYDADAATVEHAILTAYRSIEREYARKTNPPTCKTLKVGDTVSHKGSEKRVTCVNGEVFVTLDNTQLVRASEVSWP